LNYVRVLSELPDARVVVVCDPNTERLDEVHSRFPGVPLSTDFDEALSLPRVEGVVISTPATTHHDIGARALAAGRHTLIEKPLTTSVQDADDLIALAEENECVLAVGHTFLYNAGIRRLKESLESGELGRLYYLYSRRTSLGPIRHDVNALWDLASHDVSILNYVLGKSPTWVSAVGATVLRNMRHDVGFVSLAYDGVLGHIHVSWADPHKVRELVAVGSDKRVVFNDLDPIERVRIFDKGVRPIDRAEPKSFGEFHFDLRDGEITSPRVAASEPLKSVCEHFLDCVRLGTPPLTNGRVGREVVLVMEAIDRSISLNGAPVPVSGVAEHEEADWFASAATRTPA
jgi:predicted dehydrogenase